MTLEESAKKERNNAHLACISGFSFLLFSYNVVKCCEVSDLKRLLKDGEKIFDDALEQS